MGLVKSFIWVSIFFRPHTYTRMSTLKALKTKKRKGLQHVPNEERVNIREIVLGSLFFFLLPDSQCHSRIRELERVSWPEGEKNTNCCMRWSFVFVVVLGPFFLKSGRSLSHLPNSIDRGWESERVNITLWPPLLRFDFSDAHYRCCTYMNRWTSNKHALHPIFLLSLIPKTKKKCFWALRLASPRCPIRCVLEGRGKQKGDCRMQRVSSCAELLYNTHAEWNPFYLCVCCMLQSERNKDVFQLNACFFVARFSCASPPPPNPITKHQRWWFFFFLFFAVLKEMHRRKKHRHVSKPRWKKVGRCYVCLRNEKKWGWCHGASTPLFLFSAVYVSYPLITFVRHNFPPYFLGCYYPAIIATRLFFFLVLHKCKHAGKQTMQKDVLSLHPIKMSTAP